MPNITCVGCGEPREIICSSNAQDVITPLPHPIIGRTRKDMVRGVMLCGSCGAKTVFELTGNNPTFLPGKLYSGDLNEDVAKNAGRMFEEALLCFYGSAHRGVVAMCRGALEEALVDKNIHAPKPKKDDLMGKIDEAKHLKVLGEEEVSQAHGARLIGNKALHGAMPVSQSQAQIALGATVELLNRVTQYKPTPASQSRPGSNVP